MIKPTTERPIPDGPEQIEYGFAGQVAMEPSGIKKTLALNLFRFRAMQDGSMPLSTSPTVQILLSGEKAAADREIVEFLAGLDELVQKFVAAKKL